jgi:hypothetical protein
MTIYSVEQNQRRELAWDLPAIQRNRLNIEASFASSSLQNTTSTTVALFQFRPAVNTLPKLFKLSISSTAALAFSLFDDTVARGTTAQIIVPIGATSAAATAAVYKSTGSVLFLSTTIESGYIATGITYDLMAEKWYTPAPNHLLTMMLGPGAGTVYANWWWCETLD